jgi:hypothetical protein
METKRIEEIKTEATKRLNEWLKHSTFEEMSVSGSMLRFEMALGLDGYPFKKENWMGKNDFNKFLKGEEFYSTEYDNIVGELFEKELNK